MQGAAVTVISSAMFCVLGEKTPASCLPGYLQALQLEQLASEHALCTLCHQTTLGSQSEVCGARTRYSRRGAASSNNWPAKVGLYRQAFRSPPAQPEPTRRCDPVFFCYSFFLLLFPLIHRHGQAKMPAHAFPNTLDLKKQGLVRPQRRQPLTPARSRHRVQQHEW